MLNSYAKELSDLHIVVSELQLNEWSFEKAQAYSGTHGFSIDENNFSQSQMAIADFKSFDFDTLVV
jgi:hypothetical protein